MKKYVVTAIALVVLITLVGGGTGVWYWFTNFVKPVQAFESANNSMQEFSTAEFTMDVKMDLNIELSEEYDGESTTGSNELTGDGKIDIEQENLYVSLNGKTTFDGVSEDIILEEVLIGSDFYVKLTELILSRKFLLMRLMRIRDFL